MFRTLSQWSDSEAGCFHRNVLVVPKTWRATREGVQHVSSPSSFQPADGYVFLIRLVTKDFVGPHQGFSNLWLSGQCRCQRRCLRQTVRNISPRRNAHKTDFHPHQWWQSVLGLRQKRRKLPLYYWEKTATFFSFHHFSWVNIWGFAHLCLSSLAVSSWYLSLVMKTGLKNTAEATDCLGPSGDLLLTHGDSLQEQTQLWWLWHRCLSCVCSWERASAFTLRVQHLS